MSSKRTLEQIERRLEIIETILHLRDPGGTRSAEVFEGLRSRVEAIAGERRRHLLDLVELHRQAVSRAQELPDGDAAALLGGIDQALSREGVRTQGKEGDKLIPQLFEIVGERPSGPAIISRIHALAYVDSQTGEVVAQGRVEASAATTSDGQGD